MWCLFGALHVSGSSTSPMKYIVLNATNNTNRKSKTMRRSIAIGLMMLGFVACHTSKTPNVPEDENHSCQPDHCPPPKQSGEVKVEAEFVVSAEYQVCTEEMLHIVGEYCPEVRQTCLEWMSKEEIGKPWARCKRYQAPSVCLSQHRTHMDYCIDKEELHDENGIPYGDLSWTKAKQMCEERGARLCSADEWTFAAEGEQMFPYPYGDGFTFSNTICNIERHPMVDARGKIMDHRAPITAFPDCVSKTGIHNATGNVDEWIEVPRYASSKDPNLTMRSALVGGHFLGGRHKVRAQTRDHSENFTNPETLGTRCCKALD
jgi:formylglycine-generating enzyme required for sulfatase activity